MCDGSQKFWNGTRDFVLRNIIWDDDCDYVEFDCDFPGQPYDVDVRLGIHATEIKIDGYQAMPDGSMPDCGVTNNNLRGRIGSFRPCEGGSRTFLILDLSSLDPHLHGMSGAPVLVLDRNESVVGVLNGSLRQEGGRDFVAVQP
jgi:hypothetical protein